MNALLLRETWLLRMFGLVKIPMIAYLTPKVLELSEKKAAIQIPLSWRSKNHLGSMYFGALSVGADCAGGLMAMKLIREKGNRVSLVFKDFHGEFLKRPDSDVVFTCEDGPAIRNLVDKALESGQRENLPVHIVATCPKTSGEEPMAKFTLTLSLKRRS